VREATRRRIVPLGILTALGIAYAAARPTLAATIPHLEIGEFPAALFIATPLIWLAVRPVRPPDVIESPWRRHKQIVRVLGDPETAPIEANLRAWVEHGASPERASAMLSQVDPKLGELAMQASTRRKREALLRTLIERTRSNTRA